MGGRGPGLRDPARSVDRPRGCGLPGGGQGKGSGKAEAWGSGPWNVLLRNKPRHVPREPVSALSSRDADPRSLGPAGPTSP